MSFLTSLKISGSALTAQRLRMDVVANNIANSETSEAQSGEPYKRQQVVFSPIKSTVRPLQAGEKRQSQLREEGVKVSAIVRQETPPKVVYEPENPRADADGNVAYPDIDIITEMTDMISASRAYEANVTAINVAKSMAAKALEIGR